jgi:hypothetical protein
VVSNVSQSKQEDNTRTEKVVKSEIEFGIILRSLTLCINFK